MVVVSFDAASVQAERSKTYPCFIVFSIFIAILTEFMFHLIMYRISVQFLIASQWHSWMYNRKLHMFTPTILELIKIVKIQYLEVE